MENEIIKNNETELVIYEAKDGNVKLDVNLKNETVWLTANQMSLIFNRDEKVIRKHINNVFSEGELDKENNTQKMRVDGVKQQVPFYTLNVIISAGYRVRHWANSVLKEYIIKGYSVNYNRIY